MLGDFSFSSPTTLHFGRHSLDRLAGELARTGPVVQLSWGSGSLKRTGVYDRVAGILKDCGKTLVDDGGVMPNPTIDRVRRGARLARESGADLILACGGGSVCDYAKCVAASAWLDGADPWDWYIVRRKPLPADLRLPAVGCVLTMTGTGSEMNATTVITNPATREKLSAKFGPRLCPRFAILNPEYTCTLPRRQMVAGIYDIFSHLCEQYFSGEDDCVSDYLTEGLMRQVIAASEKALADPMDYEARSNIMWCATWALNGLLNLGKKGDWMVHKFGHVVSAYTDATHGMTLSAVAMPYYRFMLPFGTAKFARFAVTVWNVNPGGKTERGIAEEGLARKEAWMRRLGVAMSLKELGVTRDMLAPMTRSVPLLDAGYHRLTRDEAGLIFERSFGA